MDIQKLQELFIKIAEGTGEESMDSAMEIINGADDTVLRSELNNFVTTMMTAKTSADMDKVGDALKLYFKKQMAKVFIQAFTFGQKYQHAIDIVSIQGAMEEAVEEVGQSSIEEAIIEEEEKSAEE